jgi:heme/copper-type cytochrome/quinol oxidase subunit 3
MQQTMRTVRPAARQEVVPSGLLGMVIFVGTEVMFFAGLISAFTIARAGARPDQWMLPTEPMLPAASTLVNTFALLVSGAWTFAAHRAHRRGDAGAARLLLAAWIFGAAFVALQGREWVGLVAQGLTIRSSALGSFFYLIVGAHAVHAAGALVALGVAWRRLRHGTLTAGFFLGAQTFWYFVVGLWPIIYLRVYF